jgi:leucyl/phenylalanyl-tRNA---protein transferase
MQLELTGELILKAYKLGIFPMGDEDGVVRWYSPDPRTIIELEQFHVSRRLARKCRHGDFEIKVDSDWHQIVAGCAARPATWISQSIYQAYTQLHYMGFAHCVGAYQDGVLAGGLYGVSLGGAFMGESMFHQVTDASKVCLVSLVQRLRQRGYVLLDCQYMTAHLAGFGAVTIARQEYLLRLQDALTRECSFD